MFAIYDINGCSFRDTLENLRKVKKSPAPRRPSLLPRGEETIDQNTFGGRSVSTQACQAYRGKVQINERESVIHAYQIMSHPVESIQLTVDIVSAWKHIRAMRHHQLPVLDIKQRIVGMLTERDLLQFLIVDDNQIMSQRNKIVADAMSTQVVAADPVTDIRRVAQVMLDYRQSAVPVTNEDDELVGLVSRSDILQAATSDPPLSLWA